MPYAYSEDHDSGRSNPNPHFRLYLTKDGVVDVIEVQDFDYAHYDARRFAHPTNFDTEGDAESALVALLPALRDAITATDMLANDLRHRVIARLLRQAADDEVLLGDDHD